MPPELRDRKNALVRLGAGGRAPIMATFITAIDASAGVPAPRFAALNYEVTQLTLSQPSIAP